MNSSLIGKIEKAHRYAEEPDRIRIQGLTATFRGEHDEYQIEVRDGEWKCSCHTFASHVIGTCSHVMAMQLMLERMLPDSARYWDEESVVAAPAGAGAS